MTVVAVLLAANTACSQWSFLLDQGFRTQIQEKNVNSMALMPDGNLLLSGRIRFPGDMSDRSAARLLPNGQRDLSFPTFPQTTGGGRITPWVGGKFYVGTTTVRRLMPDGLIDPSFIAPHNSPYFQGGSGGGGDYHVYPDGHILLSGRHLLSDSIRGFEGYYNLIWFSNEGYLDTTRTHRQGNGVVNRFAELPNGQFICSGTCTEFEGKAVDWIFRVNADGTTDTTFRTGVYIGGAYAYLPLPDGRVYAGGNFRRAEAPDDTLRLVRFMPDGSLDPSFNIPSFDDGTLDWPVLGAAVTDLLQLSPNATLVSGLFRYVNGQPRKSICLIDSSGHLLDAFGGQGVDVFPTGFLTYSSIEQMLFDPTNSHLYLCGAYTGYNDGQVNDPLQRFVSRLLVQEITTGVRERERPHTALHLNPNPVAQGGTVQVEVQLPENFKPEGALRLSVVGSDGRLVREEYFTDHSSPLTLHTSFAAGLYHLHLSDNTRWISGAKLVVE